MYILWAFKSRSFSLLDVDGNMKGSGQFSVDDIEKNKTEKISTYSGDPSVFYHKAVHQYQCVVPQPIQHLRPKQNGCHYIEDMVKLIFLNKNHRIWIQILVKFAPRVQLTLSQHWFCYNGWALKRKLLSEPAIAKFTDTYVYIALGLGMMNL